MIILWSVLAIVASVYLLALLTDGFFIVSLDEISARLKLPSDVAGATLMAVGSSAPELAIALIALLKPGDHGDVGIGTIVGSALFNVLVITGASALARPAKVAYATVTRDVIAYSLSLGLLFWAFRDSRIELYEAAVFLAFYAAYIGVLAFWSKKLAGDEDPIAAVEEMVETGRDREGGALQRVSRAVDGVYQVLIGDPRSQFVRAFIVSIVLISALSWVLVESGIAFATAVGVPPVIVALTILAGGTSVPDMISSIVVARQGRGDMAIANAVGSNVFDVLVGLGLPWLIMIIAGRGTIAVGTQELKTSMWLLFGSVVMLYVFLITKRTLSKTEGLILVGAYIVYVAWMYATVG